MRFIYNFDGYDFPFEIDGSELMDAKYYIKQTHTNDEILKDYLEYLYPNETEYNKESVEDYGFYGTEESSFFDRYICKVCAEKSRKRAIDCW